ncbi:MAG: 16S rRNA (uracil(1498)-N(3))-methyltransferase [Burkholderiales bacterium]|nr:16S rRNA (uracil(1498)-N(3))-methyltransferase [Burkholderiales bacterium]MDQ3195416.1 16S rRNA (uracil(1498)-N(3))-methyltransferase [Pseudomonadota bacterium]
MPLARFYCPIDLETGADIRLPVAAAHHALKVLRVRTGDRLVLFNGRGGEFTALVTHCGKDAVVVGDLEFHPVERESPLAITLAQAVLNAEKMDWVVQKAVELGTARIRPLTTLRSVVRLDAGRAAKRAQHWRNIVVASCEQCGRNRIPEIGAVIALPDWLGQLKDEAEQGAVEAELRLILSPDAPASLRKLPAPNRKLTVLIGPEGGFTDDEVRATATAGFVPVALGPRILRTETAGPAALAAMQALYGDW